MILIQWRKNVIMIVNIYKDVCILKKVFIPHHAQISVRRKASGQLSFDTRRLHLLIKLLP